jgi:hypothetical protein
MFLRNLKILFIALFLSTGIAYADNKYTPTFQLRVSNTNYLRITNDEGTTKRARCIGIIAVDGTASNIGKTAITNLNITTGADGDCQPGSGVEWIIYGIVHEGAITLSHYDGSNAIPFDTSPANPTTTDLYQIDYTCQGEPSTPASGRLSVYCDSTTELFSSKNDAGLVRVLGPSVKPIYFDAGALTADGTLCADPTEQTLNSGPKTWAFSCADDNGSIFYGKVRMPSTYNGGTVTFTLSLYHATTETITFAGDFSAQCRDTTSTINSTWGTAVAADVSITTAHRVAEATSAAVTPNGSCAASSWLIFRYVVDATNFSANSANAKVIGVTINATY